MWLNYCPLPNQLLPFGHSLDSKGIFLIHESMIGPATVIAGPIESFTGQCIPVR